MQVNHEDEERTTALHESLAPAHLISSASLSGILSGTASAPTFACVEREISTSDAAVAAAQEEEGTPVAPVAAARERCSTGFTGASSSTVICQRAAADLYFPSVVAAVAADISRISSAAVEGAAEIKPDDAGAHTTGIAGRVQTVAIAAGTKGSVTKFAGAAAATTTAAAFTETTSRGNATEKGTAAGAAAECKLRTAHSTLTAPDRFWTSPLGTTTETAAAKAASDYSARTAQLLRAIFLPSTPPSFPSASFVPFRQNKKTPFAAGVVAQPPTSTAISDGGNSVGSEELLFNQSDSTFSAAGSTADREAAAIAGGTAEHVITRATSRASATLAVAATTSEFPVCASVAGGPLLAAPGKASAIEAAASKAAVTSAATEGILSPTAALAALQTHLLSRPFSGAAIAGAAEEENSCCGSSNCKAVNMYNLSAAAAVAPANKPGALSMPLPALPASATTARLAIKTRSAASAAAGSGPGAIVAQSSSLYSKSKELGGVGASSSTLRLSGKEEVYQSQLQQQERGSSDSSDNVPATVCRKGSDAPPAARSQPSLFATAARSTEPLTLNHACTPAALLAVLGEWPVFSKSADFAQEPQQHQQQSLFSLHPEDSPADTNKYAETAGVEAPPTTKAISEKEARLGASEEVAGASQRKGTPSSSTAVTRSNFHQRRQQQEQHSESQDRYTSLFEDPCVRGRISSAARRLWQQLLRLDEAENTRAAPAIASSSVKPPQQQLPYASDGDVSHLSLWSSAKSSSDTVAGENVLVEGEGRRSAATAATVDKTAAARFLVEAVEDQFEQQELQEKSQKLPWRTLCKWFRAVYKPSHGSAACLTDSSSSKGNSGSSSNSSSELVAVKQPYEEDAENAKVDDSANATKALFSAAGGDMKVQCRERTVAASVAEMSADPDCAVAATEHFYAFLSDIRQQAERLHKVSQQALRCDSLVASSHQEQQLQQQRRELQQSIVQHERQQEELRQQGLLLMQQHQQLQQQHQLLFEMQQRFQYQQPFQPQQQKQIDWLNGHLQQLQHQVQQEEHKYEQQQQQLQWQQQQLREREQQLRQQQQRQQQQLQQRRQRLKSWTFAIRHINEGFSDAVLWILSANPTFAWRNLLRELLRQDVNFVPRVISARPDHQEEQHGSLRDRKSYSTPQQKIHQPQHSLASPQHQQLINSPTLKVLQQLDGDALVEGCFIIDRVISCNKVLRHVVRGVDGRREFLEALASEEEIPIVRGWVVRCDGDNELLLTRLVGVELYPSPSASSAASSTSSTTMTKTAALFSSCSAQGIPTLPQTNFSVIYNAAGVATAASVDTAPSVYYVNDPTAGMHFSEPVQEQRQRLRMLPAPGGISAEYGTKNFTATERDLPEAAYAASAISANPAVHMSAGAGAWPPIRCFAPVPYSAAAAHIPQPPAPCPATETATPQYNNATVTSPFCFGLSHESTAIAATEVPLSRLQQQLLRAEVDLGSSGVFGALPLANVNRHEYKGGQASGCVGRFVPVGTAVRASLTYHLNNDSSNCSPSSQMKSGALGEAKGAQEAKNTSRMQQQKQQVLLSDSELASAHAHIQISLQTPPSFSSPECTVFLQKPLGFVSAHRQDALFLRCEAADFSPIIPFSVAGAAATSSRWALQQAQQQQQIRPNSSGWWTGGSDLLHKRLSYILCAEPRVVNRSGAVDAKLEALELQKQVVLVNSGSNGKSLAAEMAEKTKEADEEALAPATLATAAEGEVLSQRQRELVYSLALSCALFPAARLMGEAAAVLRHEVSLFLQQQQQQLEWSGSTAGAAAATCVAGSLDNAGADGPKKAAAEKEQPQEEDEETLTKKIEEENQSTPKKSKFQEEEEERLKHLHGLGVLLTEAQSTQWAQHRLQQGVTAARRGDLAAAMECYEAALLLKPRYPDALVARGAAHANRLLYGQALKDLTAALQREPQHASALKYRRLVLERMQQHKVQEKEKLQHQQQKQQMHETHSQRVEPGHMSSNSRTPSPPPQANAFYACTPPQQNLADNSKCSGISLAAAAARRAAVSALPCRTLAAETERSAAAAIAPALVKQQQNQQRPKEIAAAGGRGSGTSAAVELSLLQTRWRHEQIAMLHRQQQLHRSMILQQQLAHALQLDKHVSERKREQQGACTSSSRGPPSLVSLDKGVSNFVQAAPATAGTSSKKSRSDVKSSGWDDCEPKNIEKKVKRERSSGRHGRRHSSSRDSE